VYDIKQFVYTLTIFFLFYLQRSVYAFITKEKTKKKRVDMLYLYVVA